jgi:beta-N-acetylhexosaminidase
MAVAGRKTPSPLRRGAGRVLIVGLEGTALSPAEAAWLRLIRPGGIILFRRNVEEPRQVHALLRAAAVAATGSASGPLLRCMDVEGGTVDRLRDLVAPLPSLEQAAATGDPKLFTAHGRLAGREMRLLGLNVNFAPVLDLKTEASAPVMSSRVHCGDPEEAARYAAHFLDGLAKEGVLGCAKHFPGLGSGAVDSHQTTPRIDKPFAALWAEDLLPYRMLASRLPLVMVSHATYPQTRSKSDPASVSGFWITEVLRKKIGFRGLVVSDDMEMGGILSQMAIAGAAIGSLLAGTHLIEICHQPARIFAAYEALLSEAEHSPAFARQLRRAAAQVERFERKRLHPFPPVPAPKALESVRREIQKFSALLGNQPVKKQSKNHGKDQGAIEEPARRSSGRVKGGPQ